MKVQLATRDGLHPLHAKIEFSRRGLADGISFDPVDPTIVRTYELAPVSATHYTGESAFWQKVSAVADRGETQARDVFDLDLLLRIGVAPKNPPVEVRRKIETALANAPSVDFDQFAGQVLP